MTMVGWQSIGIQLVLHVCLNLVERERELFSFKYGIHARVPPTFKGRER